MMVWCARLPVSVAEPPSRLSEASVAGGDELGSATWAAAGPADKATPTAKTADRALRRAWGRASGNERSGLGKCAKNLVTRRL
jgi:hypothetical protein